MASLIRSTVYYYFKRLDYLVLGGFGAVLIPLGMTCLADPGIVNGNLDSQITYISILSILPIVLIFVLILSLAEKMIKNGFVQMQIISHHPKNKVFFAFGISGGAIGEAMYLIVSLVIYVELFIILKIHLPNGYYKALFFFTLLRGMVFLKTIFIALLFVFLFSNSYLAIFLTSVFLVMELILKVLVYVFANLCGVAQHFAMGILQSFSGNMLIYDHLLINGMNPLIQVCVFVLEMLIICACARFSTTSN